MRMSDYDTIKLCGEKTNRGYNQITSSGLPFWAADPQPEDIRIEDIANHLAKVCRYAGGIRRDIEMYSVAQHSLLVCDHVPQAFKLEAIFHDAPEYIMGDMVKPQKWLYPGRKVLERNLDAAIRIKFNLPMTLSVEVKKVDYIAVATERRDICPENYGVDWGDMPEPWPEKIVPMGIFEARDAFLDRFYELTGDRYVEG